MMNKHRIPLYILSCLAVMSLCLIALAISYYFVIYLPQRDNSANNTISNSTNNTNTINDIGNILDQIGPPANKSVLLDNCLKDAYDTETKNWNNDCITNSLGPSTNTDSPAICNLPVANANRWDQLHKEATDLCVQLYK